MADQSRLWMVSPSVALAWARDWPAEPRMYRRVATPACRATLPYLACARPCGTAPRDGGRLEFP